LTVWYSKVFLQDSRDVAKQNVEDVSSLFHMYRTYQYMSSIINDAYREWKKKVIHHALEEVDSDNAIFKMFSLFLAVRRIFAYLALLTITLLMPMYIVLTFQYSTYEKTYTWVIAGIFFTGQLPAIFLTLGFTLMLWSVSYLFRTRVYRFSARKVQDQVLHGRALDTGNVSKDGKDKIKSIERQPSLARFTLPSYFQRLAPSFSTPQEEFRRSSLPLERTRSLQRSTSSISAFTWMPTVSDMENWKNHLYQKYYNRNHFIYTLATCLFSLINFFAILLVNIVYVIYSIHLNQQNDIFIQIALSIFKIAWNEVIVWRLYPRINILCKHVVQNWNCCGMRRMRSLAQQEEETTTRNLQGAMDNVESYQYTASELNFMVFTVIFNNAIIPWFAVLTGSPHCLYDAFFKDQPTEDVELSTCQYFRIRDEITTSTSECLWYDHYYFTSQYNAPFHYRYECSAAFSIKFASVYIYMFTLVGIVLPLIIMYLQHLYNKYDPNDRYGADKKPLTNYERIVFQCVDYLLPMRWKPLTPNPPRDVNTFKLLPTERIVVRFSAYLAILLVYGVVFPPLAVIAMISIYSITYFEEFTMSRLLVESKALKYTWYQEKILKECEYIAESWFDTLKTILPFASLLYAGIIFDTLGDRYGWTTSLGPAIFVFTLPWCFYLFERIKTRLGYRSTSFGSRFASLFSSNKEEERMYGSNGNSIGNSSSITFSNFHSEVVDNSALHDPVDVELPSLHRPNDDIGNS
jgi:hypothetical protein